MSYDAVERSAPSPDREPSKSAARLSASAQRLPETQNTTIRQDLAMKGRKRILLKLAVARTDWAGIGVSEGPTKPK
jgi:hypothetical protein